MHSVFEQFDHFDIANTLVNCNYIDTNYNKVTSDNRSVDSSSINNNNNNNNNNNSSSNIKYKPVVITLLPHEADVDVNAAYSDSNAHNLNVSSSEE